jgi:DNA-binding CsgD family transcriptional regulator
MKKFNFTPQETQVANRVAKGIAPKTIAFQMQISIHTVRIYLSNLRRETGTHSLFELGTLLARNHFKK